MNAELKGRIDPSFLLNGENETRRYKRSRWKANSKTCGMRNLRSDRFAYAFSVRLLRSSGRRWLGEFDRSRSHFQRHTGRQADIEAGKKGSFFCQGLICNGRAHGYVYLVQSGLCVPSHTFFGRIADFGQSKNIRQKYRDHSASDPFRARRGYTSAL